MSPTFDALIIGSGQAGPSLAARLSAAGLKVAIVEREWFGGTCVNNGCTPTKAWIASAYAAHLARRSAEYGVLVDSGPLVDMKRVKARKDEIVRRSREGIEKWMRSLQKVQVYRGHARFVSDAKVVVGSDVLSARKIFLNVGGRPLVPRVPGVDEVPFLTSVTMMDLDFVPKRLLVVGGSYVGLEFAQMFRRFGAEVTVVEMGPRLVGREDADISHSIADFLVEEGISVRLDAKCIALHREAEGVAVGLDCLEGRPREPGTHVLLAVGRVPNTNDLGLDQAGIATDERGYIVVDEGLRTTNPNTWALGDCNGKGAFTHTAYNDYEIVADNLLSNAGRQHTDRVPVYALSPIRRSAGLG